MRCKKKKCTKIVKRSKVNAILRINIEFAKENRKAWKGGKVGWVISGSLVWLQF